jgi:hypothetical protein
MKALTIAAHWCIEQETQVRLAQSNTRDRAHLIAACRYLRPEGRLGQALGDELLALGDHPIEAKSIFEDFNPASDVYLA